MGLLMNALFMPLCMMYFLVLVKSIRRPVIGVLLQKADQSNQTTGKYSDRYVLSANYVKALEGAGAMVVPVKINQDISYYWKIMNTINGLVLPGGSADLQDPTDIGKAGAILYKIAQEINDKGVYFPILGMCQGLQLLAEASAGMVPFLKPCKGLTNVGLPLKFVINPSESYLYRSAPSEVIGILTTEPVTANNHNFCVTQKTLKQYNLTSTWRVMTVDRDDNGMQFITSMEHTRYPFAAVQFHPEKIIYDMAEWFKFQTDHRAIIANRWFYDWFVEMSKKNKNVDPKITRYIMENYCPTLVLEPGFGIFDKYFISV